MILHHFQALWKEQMHRALTLVALLSPLEKVLTVARVMGTPSSLRLCIREQAPKSAGPLQPAQLGSLRTFSQQLSLHVRKHP